MTEIPKIDPIKISIVTPSLNQGQFIDAAIRSVLNQHYPALEHIVVDGVSSDETLDVLRNYTHLIWVSEPNKGQSDGLNIGFRMATGDIIGWLNTDDLYLPGCFDTVVDFFRRHPEVDVVYGDIRWITSQGKVTQLRREVGFDKFMLRYLHILYIPTNSTFFRRRILDDGFFLSIDFHYAMDYEFFCRLANAGYKFAHVDAFLADFRWHTDSKSSDPSGKQRAEHRQVQLECDPWLIHLKSGWLKTGALKILTLLARCKRYVIKGSRGYYFSQWVRQ